MRLLDLLEASRKLEGRVKWRGLNISIENAKGSIRQGVGKDGIPWRVRMTWPYGYIRLTKGVDNGDQVDCFIGPDKEAKYVYVIRTKEPTTGKSDENKCMLNFSSADTAKKAFLDNYSSEDFFGAMTVLTWQEFKKKALETKDNPKFITANKN